LDPFVWRRNHGATGTSWLAPRIPANRSLGALEVKTLAAGPWPLARAPAFSAGGSTRREEDPVGPRRRTGEDDRDGGLALSLEPRWVGLDGKVEVISGRFAVRP